MLQELKQQNQSKSQLKNLLILLARILAITCLVFAFSQPVIRNVQQNKFQGEKGISVYLDNSFSMEGVNKNGYLLEQAKRKAREIALGFGVTDKFQLLTNDFEGKHQKLLSREEFLTYVDEVKSSPAFKTISEIIARQNDLFNQMNIRDKKFFYCSDFQNRMFDIANYKADSTINAILIPLQPNSTNNIYIDSCWFENPVQQIATVQKLHVRVQNKSDKKIENSSLRLFINNKQVAPSTFEADQNTAAEIVFSFLIKESGIHQGKLQLDDHPITYDDSYFFSFFVNQKIPALLIKGKNENSSAYIRSLFSLDSICNYSEQEEIAINYSSFSSNDLILLNGVQNLTSGLSQEIKKFVSNGGSVVFFPSTQTDLNNTNAFLSSLGLSQFANLDTANTVVEKINIEQGLFENVFEKQTANVDLPKIFNHFSTLKNSQSRGEEILTMLNGDPYLTQYKIEKGKFYLFTSALDQEHSSLSKHALFVPALYKMLINSQTWNPLYYKINTNQQIELNKVIINAQDPLHISKSDGSGDFIPEIKNENSGVKIFTQNQCKTSGNYFIKNKQNNIAGISFNYHPLESDLGYFTTDQIQSKFDELNLSNFSLIAYTDRNLSVELEQISQGKKLWKLFILLGLIFIAIEILLIRLLK